MKLVDSVERLERLRVNKVTWKTIYDCRYLLMWNRAKPDFQFSYKKNNVQSNKKGNDQKLIQSHPTSHSHYQTGEKFAHKI